MSLLPQLTQWLPATVTGLVPGRSATAHMTVLAFNPLSPHDYLATFGVIGVLLVLFAETGLLLGFFLPGDTLLFAAGIATIGVGGTQLNFPALIIGCPIAAIVGAQLGHYIGARLGHAVFDRPNSRLITRDKVERAEHYFNKFGPRKAIVLARFIPVVRTFLNPVVGALEVPAKMFLVWNIVGGVIWTEGVLIAGHLLGQHIPASVIDKYLVPVVLLAVLVSLIPVVLDVLRSRRRGRSAPRVK